MRPVCNVQSCRYYLPHTGIARPGWRPVVLDITLHWCIVPSRTFQMYETYLPPQRQGWLAWRCLLLKTHITSQRAITSKQHLQSTLIPPYTLYPSTLHTAGDPESETWHLPSPSAYDTVELSGLCLSVRSDKRPLLVLVGTRSQQQQCDTIGIRKTSSGLRIPSCSRPYALPITALSPLDACRI